MAPVAPISSDGHSVGAEPTVTWKPGRDSRIICITFSMFPELSLMLVLAGGHYHQSRQAGMAGRHRRARPRWHDRARRKRIPHAGAVVFASARQALCGARLAVGPRR